MKRPKSKKKTAIAESRVNPEIYVRIETDKNWRTTQYVKAKIRIRSGKYQYLQWRDGETIRSLYLGTKRKA